MAAMSPDKRHQPGFRPRSSSVRNILINLTPAAKVSISQLFTAIILNSAMHEKSQLKYELYSYLSLLYGFTDNLGQIALFQPYDTQ